MDEAIGAWLASHTRDGALAALNDYRVPAGPVNTIEDIYADPHIAARARRLGSDARFSR